MELIQWVFDRAEIMLHLHVLTVRDVNCSMLRVYKLYDLPYTQLNGKPGNSSIHGIIMNCVSLLCVCPVTAQRMSFSSYPGTMYSGQSDITALPLHLLV